MTYEIETSSIDEFWSWLSPEKCIFKKPSKCIYRGQKDAWWSLEPSIFRETYVERFKDNVFRHSVENRIFLERNFLKEFIENCDEIGFPLPNDSREFRKKYVNEFRIENYLNNINTWPESDLYDVMALAQHYGMPTRLLDWSKKAYVAAYFAASSFLSSSNEERDNIEKLAIWVLNTSCENLYPRLEIIKSPSYGLNKNIVSQSGCFTLLRDEHEHRSDNFNVPIPLDEYISGILGFNHLQKITIPVEFAPEILDKCKLYGVSGTVYFGYDGAAKSAIDVINIMSYNHKKRNKTLN